MKALQESEQKKPWTGIHGSSFGTKALRRVCIRKVRLGDQKRNEHKLQLWA